MENISKPTTLDDTLNYIFKMNEKEVFMNEIQNMIEEIDSNSIQQCKIPILVNFILYKLSELESHQKIAETLQNHYKSNNIKNSFNIFCNKESFTTIKNAIVETLIAKIIDLEGISLDFLKKLIIPDNSKITNSQMKVYKMLENKFREKENKMKNNSEINAKINYGNNFYQNSSNDQNNLCNLNMVEDFFNLPQEEANSQFNYMTNQFTPNMQFYNYKLRIYYLDGSDSYFQLVNIKSKSSLDYNAFIFSLKKKLGIYENSKFKIIILENKKEKEFFTEMSQLKIEDTNEMKIVPVHYLINSGGLGNY